MFEASSVPVRDAEIRCKNSSFAWQRVVIVSVRTIAGAPVKNSAKSLPAKAPAKARDFMDDQEDDGFLDWDSTAPGTPVAGASAFPFGDSPPAQPAAAGPAIPAAPSPAPAHMQRRLRDRLIRLMIGAALILVWTLAAIAFFARDDDQPVPAHPAVTHKPGTVPVAVTAADRAPQTVIAPAPGAAAAPLPAASLAGPPAVRIPERRAEAAPPLSVPHRATVRPSTAEAERARQARRGRPAWDASAAGSAAPVHADTITCILPSGQDVVMSQAACRARSGLIYR
jgi:hypothetical protein